MHYLILLFAVFLLATGVVMLVKPMALFGVMEKYARSLELQVVAVVVRIILGVVFILAAEDTKFPMVIQIIGWLMIVAGIIVAVIGRRRFIGLMEWAMPVLPKYGFIVGLVAIVFGGFLGYAVV